MTDEQIIKTFSNCFNRGFDELNCNECPFYTATLKCTEDLEKSIIDLINRQKAEIERSENLNEQLSNDIDIKYNLICKLEEDLRNSKSESIKEFAKFIIDESKNATISISDIPDYVKRMTGELPK